MYTNIRVPFESLQEEWCQPLEREMNFASRMKKPKPNLSTNITFKTQDVEKSRLQRITSYTLGIFERLRPFKVPLNFGQCPICLEDMHSAARITHCAHIFHAHCLRKSLEIIGDSCPMCRNPILDSLLGQEVRDIQNSEFAYWHQQM